MFSEWHARKLSKLLAMWNPYQKSDLEDIPLIKAKLSGTRVFIFTQGIVGYSGWVKWCLKLLSIQQFTGQGQQKGLSQMRTPVKVSRTFCPLIFFCRVQRNVLRSTTHVLRQAATHLRGVIRYAWFRGKCCASATTQHLKRALPGTYVFFAIFLAFMVKYLSEKQMILGSASLDLTAYISKREICR